MRETKPAVMEEFIEEKAKELYGKFKIISKDLRDEYKDFIRSLVREMPVKKATVGEDIVSRYKILFHDASPSMIEQLIRKLIREIQGVEVVKK